MQIGADVYTNPTVTVMNILPHFTSRLMATLLKFIAVVSKRRVTIIFETKYDKGNSLCTIELCKYDEREQ